MGCVLRRLAVNSSDCCSRAASSPTSSPTRLPFNERCKKKPQVNVCVSHLHAAATTTHTAIFFFLFRAWRRGPADLDFFFFFKWRQCLCIAGCLWSFVMECKPWRRHWGACATPPHPSGQSSSPARRSNATLCFPLLPALPASPPSSG